MVKNVLSETEIEEIVNLCDYEVDNFLCVHPNVPKYQSYSDMHKKYKKHLTFKKVIDSAILGAKDIDPSVNLTQCWFNVSRKDSTGWCWHTHPFKYAAVFYLKNTLNNGTMFNINGHYIKNKGTENTIEYFDSSILHSIDPEWKGMDRYTIAFDFD
jgi:hypothetical protein